MRSPRCLQDPLDELQDWLLPDQPEQNPIVVGARALFLVVLAVWWFRLLFLPYYGPTLLGSVLHLIHLPFHEAGHIVFMPCGEFLYILGGTLGQLLVPVIVMVAFLRQQDPFGAAVGGWWLGQSFMDCAPYIDDARAGVLPLVSGACGQEDRGGHDWYQILSRTGTLHYDHALARCFWGFGVLVMLAALAWAAVVLVRQIRGRGLWRALD